MPRLTHIKNQEVRLTITDLTDAGEGIGHLEDGYTVFVKDALIGDDIRAKLIKTTPKYGYGRLLQILAASPDRTEPLCPQARACGGCQIQAMDYEAQLRYKEQRVRSVLTRIGSFDPAELDRVMQPILGMEDPYRYRNKAQYPVGTRDGRIVVGFYAVRSHSIVPVMDCCLQRPENATILKVVLGYMRQFHVPAYDESTGKGLLRHILIRDGRRSGQVMVCLVANGAKLPHARELTEQLAALPGVCSVVLNVNTRRDNVILGEETKCLYGEPFIRDALRVLDYDEETDAFTESGREVSFDISARSFYQVNPRQTERLYGLVRHYAGLAGKERVLDLYCGIGTISLYLADRAGEVTGIEVVPEAVADATANAAHNGIGNARFETARAEDWAARYLAQADRERVDLVVVDPPRKGLDPTTKQAILAMAPERLIYVSCDPATLARDLRDLREGGYHAERIRPVDQFPHTLHVECVTLLQRMSNTRERTITLDVEMEDYHRIISGNNHQ